MASAPKLYGRYLGISIRSQMQYRMSFVLHSVGECLGTFLELFALVALFERFGTLSGWQLHEVALLYGMVNVSFAIADATSRGFDRFGNMVRTGDFDRLLVRPRSTGLQIAGEELTLFRIGRLSVGVFLVIWAGTTGNIGWSPATLALLGIAISGGACLFYGLFVLQATLAFWTTETLEIMNTLTYGGKETACYPMAIYRTWFREFFTYVEFPGF